MFRLTAMSFKSSTKNKWFVVVSRLPKGPIWYPFKFFNENESGFTERMNNNTERLSPWKIPRR